MEALHRARDACVCNGHEDVVVVAEQGVAVKLELISGRGGRQPLEEVLTVRVRNEQEAIVAAVGTVVVVPLEEAARPPLHVV